MNTSTKSPTRDVDSDSKPAPHDASDDSVGTPQSFKGDAANVGRGLLMGGADIIPGVSGGTVALILGIYQRLVGAISRFDGHFLALVRERRWAEAASHVDLRFLAGLGTGIAVGIAGLATLMTHLLEHHAQFTYSAFFGLIAASSVLVGRMVARWSPLEVGLLITGAVFAYWLVGLLPADAPDSLAYVFLCGTIGICAMILPGISGAFILVILGKYEDITGLVKGAVHGDVSAGSLLTMGVFGIGCVVGLLTFSKVLRWLLARHESVTMAVLCGFMAGSLRKIWPFKAAEAPVGVHSEKVDFRGNVWPETFGGTEWTCLLLAVAAAALVLVLDAVTGHAAEKEVEEVAESADG